MDPVTDNSNVSSEPIESFNPKSSPEQELSNVARDTIVNTFPIDHTIDDWNLGTRHHRYKPTAVLSIDGGGVRGVIPARIVQEIMKRTGQPLHETFEIQAGTSAGSLVLTSLNCPSASGDGSAHYCPEDLVNRFIEDSEQIFPPSFSRNITTLWGALSPRYTVDGLEALLQEYLGDVHMTEALCKDLIIPAFDTVSYTMGYFSKQRCLSEPDFGPVLMRDAVRASTAAPTFFDAKDMRIGKRDYSFVDGGLSVNNPVMYGFTRAIHMVDKPSELLVCSIGTGSPLTSHYSKDWGAISWAPKLVEAAIAGQSDAAHVQMQNLIGGGTNQRYYRFQPTIARENYRLDNSARENLYALYDSAEEWIEANDDELRDLCKKLDPDDPSCM